MSILYAYTKSHFELKTKFNIFAVLLLTPHYDQVSERKVEEIISEDIKIPEISKELEERTTTEPPSKIDVGPELEEG